jgi:hypothetical protein
MTSESHASSLDELSALMEERQKYEAWLLALEARRAGTPEHVFKRVHADYTGRLRGVVDTLSSHRGTLQQQYESLTVQIGSLEAEEQLRRDERAELELRSHVGEVQASEFEAAVQAIDAALSKLTKERETVTQLHDRTHHFLILATPGHVPVTSPHPTVDRPPAAAPAPPPPPAAADRQPPAAAAPVVAAPTVAGPPAPARAPAEADVPRQPHPAPDGNRANVPAANAFDELAFLNAVVGPERGAGSRPARPQAAAPQEAARAADHSDPAIVPDEAGQLADSLVSRPHRASVAGFVREEGVTQSLVGSGDGGLGVEAPLASNVTGNNPIVLRPSGEHLQRKTLKCNDCGAMNFPTEWYCERCGGELASL